ncbi:hypothetical protein JW911_00160 [Candidatus Peregrinibacteria bacterium]|nr:hypothetical protein [Candidatus Peregrinibacteria bacterium]
MSQVILARNTINYRRRHASYNFGQLKTFLMIVSMGITISFLSVMMLVHFNQVSTRGYTIKYLEVKRQELIEQNEIIQNNLLEKKALTMLSVTDKANSMHKPSDVHYVSGYSAIAKK